MVIGDVTLDPRRVLYSLIGRDDYGWKLEIVYQVGNTATSLIQHGTKKAMLKLADDLD